MWWNQALDFLKTIWPSLVGAFKLMVAAKVAQEVQRGRDAANELERVDQAMRAGDRVDLLSDDDVVRELKKRGLYHSGEATTGNKGR
jgi:hypothetical protein